MNGNKIKVGILGATGSVGQKFVELLINHPWFEIAALAASEKSAGKKYGEAANWIMRSPLPEQIAAMPVMPAEPNLPCRIVFSALDSGIAGKIEENFRDAGYAVISNAKNHRMEPNVPLIIPEINGAQLELVKSQKSSGLIVTNPNCSTIGLVFALKPLLDNFGLEAVNVTTLQALSGAGYPGVSSLDILDNVIPFIKDEEEKIQTEPLKIFGEKFKISATCTRVGVIDGHLECVSVKLKKSASPEEIKNAWVNFRGEPQKLKLPSAPECPIHYFEEAAFPQPRLHRNIDKGMAVSIGRLRPCPLFDYKFVILSHNTARGAAGGTILIAELMLKNGYLEKFIQ